MIKNKRLSKAIGEVSWAVFKELLQIEISHETRMAVFLSIQLPITLCF